MAASGPLPSPRWRWLVLAVVVVVAILAIAGAFPWLLWYHPTPPAPTTGPGASGREIDLLPSTGTRSGCIRGVPGVPRPELPLADGAFQANTYNVPTGTVGGVGMCYNAPDGLMFAYANWSHVGGAGGWFSYPQIAYGVDLYDGVHTTYTNQSAAWALPQNVSTVVNSSLWVSATYDLLPPSASDVTGYDLSFDDFLSEGLPPTLNVPPFVEIEIFLAHNISYPQRWINWTSPTVVNGTVSVEPWSIAYWCHGADNGTNGNVSFDFSFEGQSTLGLRVGTLGVNLSSMFAEVDRLLPGATCWTGPAQKFGAFYLGEEDLGSEDGARGGVAYNYSWIVDSYCLLPAADPNVAGFGCHILGGATPEIRNVVASPGSEIVTVPRSRTGTEVAADRRGRPRTVRPSTPEFLRPSGRRTG